jgi:hypothetical protein
MLKLFVTITVMLFFAAIATYPTGAEACEGRYRKSIQQYIDSHPDYTIFEGTVVSTTPGWQQRLGRSAASTIRVSKWHAGLKPAKIMTLPHQIPPASAFKAPCSDMVNQFEARTGEQWLIIGTPVGDMIEPDQDLSIRAQTGVFPVELMREIDAIRPALPSGVR